MAHGTRFTVGTVIAIDFKDGCGFTVGTIVGESYKYSAADGQEHTFFQVTPAPNQGLDEPFQISLDEAFVYGVALPSTVLGART
jgi:hypothetical protein